MKKDQQGACKIKLPAVPISLWIKLHARLGCFMLGILENSRFFKTLQSYDEDICDAERQAGCRFCKGPLDAGHYQRKPRGLEWAELDEPSLKRFSLCCRNDGCRKRSTPLSLRFAGRKVYCALFILLYACFNDLNQKRTLKQLHKKYGVDQRTGRRWILLFAQCLPQSHWWKGKSGLQVFVNGAEAIKVSQIFALVEPSKSSEERWRLFLQLTRDLWHELI